MNKSNNEYRKLKITNNIDLTSISIMIFILYSSTYHVYFSIIDSFKLQIIIIGLSIIILFYDQLKLNKEILITKLDILWILFLIVFIINFRISNILILADFILYSMFIAFLILSKVKIDSFNNAILLVKYIALFYAVGVFIQYLLPGFYMDFILPIFNENGQNRIMYLFNKGLYTGFTHQTAYTAGYLINGIGAFMLSYKINSKKNIYIDIFICIMLLIALILTGKRAHFLFMIISLFLIYLYSAIKTKKIKEFYKTFAIALTIIAAIIGIMYIINVDIFIKRIYDTIIGILQGKDISNGRTILYKEAWSNFLENPIFGIGWRQFSEKYMGILINGKKSHPHNIYLQLLAETGIVGFTLFIIPLIYVIIKTIKILSIILEKNKKNEIYWEYSLMYSLYIQIFFILYGLTGNVLTDKSFLSIYFLACSITGTALINFSDRKDYFSIQKIIRKYLDIIKTNIL